MSGKALTAFTERLDRPLRSKIAVQDLEVLGGDAYGLLGGSGRCCPCYSAIAQIREEPSWRRWDRLGEGLPPPWPGQGCGGPLLDWGGAARGAADLVSLADGTDLFTRRSTNENGR